MQHKIPCKTRDEMQNQARSQMQTQNKYLIIHYLENHYPRIRALFAKLFIRLFGRIHARFQPLHLVTFAGLFTALAFIFSACATDVKNLEHFSQLYYMDSAQKAHHFAQKKAQDDDLLWLIQAGISGFSVDAKDTGKILEKSEDVFNEFEKAGILTSGLAQTGAVLVNDNAMSYKGNIYEGVFLNYYKALHFMSERNYMSARVELNRANDRQRRAKEYYTKQINEALESSNEQLQKSELASISSLAQRSKSFDEINPIIAQKYTNLAKFQAFDGFINPAVSYLSGLFFLLEGDSKGLDYLKEAYGMTNSKIIASDMLYFSGGGASGRGGGANGANGAGTDKYTWIILESGRQAHKSEESFSLPLFTSSGLYHFGIALPQFEAGVDYERGFVLDFGASGVSGAGANGGASGGKSSAGAFEEIVNTDDIIATEFEKQLNAIASRAIISASVKLASQIALTQGLKQVDESVSLIASLVSGVYSMATTAADLRIASVLPRRIYIAKIRHDNLRDSIDSSINGGGALQILASNHAPFRINVENCQANDDSSTAGAPNAKNKGKSTGAGKNANASKIAQANICLNQNSILYLRYTPAQIHHKLIWQE